MQIEAKLDVSIPFKTSGRLSSKLGKWIVGGDKYKIQSGRGYFHKTGTEL